MRWHSSAGGHDTGQAIADAVPDGRTAVVRGAAHWCHLEAPDAVNEILLGFAEELAT